MNDRKGGNGTKVDKNSVRAGDFDCETLHVSALSVEYERKKKPFKASIPKRQDEHSFLT